MPIPGVRRLHDRMAGGSDFGMSPSSAHVPSIKVLGVRVHMVQIPEVVQLIAQWIESDRQKCHQIVNTGMHGIMEAHKSLDFKCILNSADLFFPDGIAVAWIANRRGFPLKKQGTGPGLLREYCQLARGKGYKNFFYGDTEETLRRLVENLTKDFPELKIAGTCSPPFRSLTPEEDEAVVRMINHAKPDVLWVGLGCPKQERWIYEHKDRLAVPVAIGVGASFKFYSGQVKRAPAWVGDHGFEWLWRLILEPQRIWRRVIIDAPHFAFHVAMESLDSKRRGNG